MPETDATELSITLRFEGNEGVTAGTLATVLRVADRAVLDAAVEELRALREQAVAPELAIDAAIGRAGDYAGSALRIERATAGSIILLGAGGTALALWLLEHTLGKTVEEAWADSLLHRTLKDWMAARLDAQAGRVAWRIQRLLGRRGIEAHVSAVPALPNGTAPVVEVRVAADPGFHEAAPGKIRTMRPLSFKKPGGTPATPSGGKQGGGEGG